MDGDGLEKAPAPVRDSRRRFENDRIVLVVLVANAELARVAVTLVAVGDADEVAPPLHFDDVLSFIRRRRSGAAATCSSTPQEAW